MPKLIKYLFDFAALTLLSFLRLCPKRKHRGKRVLAVNTVLFLYLSVSLPVTLCRSFLRCRFVSATHTLPCAWSHLRMT